MKLNMRIAGTILVLAFPMSSAFAQDSGRLLASNCFQCHGTDGRDSGFERLAGMPAAEIIEEMWELRISQAAAEADEEIMTVHANGYTQAQVALIAEYLSKIARTSNGAAATAKPAATTSDDD